MKDESLADGSPVLLPRRREEAEDEDDAEAEDDADDGEDWADEEHDAENIKSILIISSSEQVQTNLVEPFSNHCSAILVKL